jgi:PAS domain S-box-containing protein
MQMLVFLSGRQKGLRIACDRDRMVMGRDPACDLVLDDAGSSRQHCELVKRGEAVLLRDLKSTNGTYLNDRKTEEATLADGDKISVGETSLLFQAAREAGVRESVSLREDGSTTVLTGSFRMELASLGAGAESTDAAERTLALLQRFNQEVGRALDMPALLRRTLEFLFEALPDAERGAAMLINRAGDLENHAVRRRESAPRDPIAISKSLAEMVLEKNEALLSTDVSADARLGVEDTAAGAKSVMICPLAVQDKRLGLIYIDSTAGTGFTDRHLRLMSIIAMQAASAVENVRLYGELMNAMEYQAGVLRAMLAGIIVTDLDGIVTQVNPAALETIGLAEPDIMGKRLKDIQHLRPIASLLEETRRARRAFDRMEVVLSVRGEEITVGLSTSILSNVDGSVSGLIASFRDISIIKQLSEKVRATGHLAALGEMAAGVAHEIRNPLNSIRGFAELLTERLQDKDHREWAGVILEQVDRMNGIVQGLLDYARQQNFPMEQTDLGRVVQETLHECAPAMESAKVEVKTLVDSALPRVPANANKLKQVFLNIALNARDAMAGGGTLTARARERSGQNGREVAVSFTDTGCGIEPEHIGRVFDPFFTRKEGGTGLGLAICHRIVTAHGGTIDVSSRPGHGSTFTVAIPCGRRTAGESADKTG